MKVVEIGWLILLACSIALPLTVRHAGLRHAIVWLLPMAGLALLFVYREAPAWQRLVAASAGMIYVFKGSIMASFSREQARRNSPAAFLLWPGMAPESLSTRGKALDTDALPFARGLGFLYAGLALMILTALSPLPAAVTGWTTLAALLLICHFGLSEIMTSAMRLSGRGVRPLFDRPLAARTLNEFWTRRWNLAFVELDRRLFLPALLKRFGYRGAILAVFLISGLLHEMAISYPSGGGWGLPFCYFAIQGLLVLLERKAKLRSRLFTWAAILLPVSLVFTGAFRATFMAPSASALRQALISHPVSWYFDRGLWFMGAAHFLVLVASFQVPSKLRWREELCRLSPFNRKLMYAYGAFIVLTIGTFGAFTLCLHHDLLIGSPAALFFAGFISLFWFLRIGLDVFYYRSEDWPKGPQFVVGHALLNSLFLFLSLSYGTLVVWRLTTG